MVQGCRRDPAVQDNASQPASQAPVVSEAQLINKADSLFEVGKNYTRQHQPDSALLTHLKVVEIREKLNPDERLVNSLKTVAEIYFDDVKYYQADKFFEKARRAAETISSPDTVLIRIYYDLASCKVQLSDYPTALSLTQKTLQLVRLHENETTLSMARIYRKLGTISFYKMEYEEAIRQYSEAIRLTNPTDNKELTQLNSMTGITYHEAKMDHRALSHYYKALQYVKRWSSVDTDERAKIYLQKAGAHFGLGQLDSARYCYIKNLQIRKDVFGEKNVNTFGAKYSLGNFYFKTGNYDSATWYLQNSLISLVKGFDQQNLMSNPNPAPDELSIDVIHTLLRKATVLKKMFDKEPSQEVLLEVSLRTYLLADSIFDVFCSNNLTEDAVLVQMEKEHMPYAEMLQTAVALYDRRHTNQYLFNILEIMERSRATLLRNALGKAQAFGTAGIPPEFLEKENELIRLRADILQQLGRVKRPQKAVDSLYERLLKVNNLHADLQLDLEKSNPNYASIKYGFRLLSLDALQGLLGKKNSVLLEYFWSEEDIFCLLVTSDTMRLKVIPVTGIIKKALAGYAQGLQASPDLQDELKFRDFLQSSQDLYHYLVEGFLQHIQPGTHLIVSADGPLATLPFEALVTKSVFSDEVNYKLPYLVLEHPISYTYSSDILLQQSKKLREGDRLLAYGYAGNLATSKSRRDGTDLPGTEKEVLAIRDVMKNGRNEYLLEGAASENSFKKHAGEFDIVHLAIHGKADTLNSLNSKLIFRTEADTVEDGNLYAHELYDLNLKNLDLAVLSACESGVGKQQMGEGVMSIARGFSYAGCPSLVISLWKIDDRTSAEVMSRFYRYTSTGSDLDEALALAKVNYLTSASEFTSHPYYWSAFLQVGDTRAIEKRRLQFAWLALPIGTLIFVIIYFMRRSRKHESAN